MLVHFTYRVAIMVTATMICSTPAMAEPRTWTDNTGKHTIEAELVKVQGNKITLERADGKLVTLPLSRLSDSDRQYLRSLQKQGSPKNKSGPAPDFNGPKAAGKFHGQDFLVEHTELQAGGGILTLRQGKEFFPDLAVVIFLFLEEGQSPEGKKYNISGKQDFSVTTPHIHMQFMEADGRAPKTQMFMGKYQMELIFGKSDKGIVPGWIKLRLPDENESKITGSFAIDLSGEKYAVETGKR